eukprot:TRINITY_DN95241_c0_g1_i1.p1 TRINITY_DN95241_c0_g1~~TRINITY_DN95241_c0_g1_i1.p1  ORF type:complete len:105 (+),score=2.97 TRINITY_DN95241_c0_g1_i1:276-590(+)
MAYNVAEAGRRVVVWRLLASVVAILEFIVATWRQIQRSFQASGVMFGIRSNMIPNVQTTSPASRAPRTKTVRPGKVNFKNAGMRVQFFNQSRGNIIANMYLEIS